MSREEMKSSFLMALMCGTMFGLWRENLFAGLFLWIFCLILMMALRK